MTNADGLSRHNIEEYQRRLLHIDELMVQARKAATEGRAAAGTDELLARVEADRVRLERDIEDLSRWPPTEKTSAAHHSAGIGSMLQSIGAELEKAIAAIIEHGPGPRTGSRG